MPNVKKIRGFNLPGTPWVTSACCGRPLPFTYVFMYRTRYYCQILINLEFSTDFRNFMKILPVREELFHANRQRHITKLIVISRNFGNAPDMKLWISGIIFFESVIYYDYTGKGFGQIMCLGQKFFESTQLHCPFFIIIIIGIRPVWAQTRTQSGDWYSSGTLHPGQVLRGRLPFLPPVF